METDGNIIIANNLDSFFWELSADCPYGLPHPAIYRQGPFGRLPDELVEHFLASGYRRNGNTIYTMACRDCASCVPIRLVAQEFSPDRNQKRVTRKNRDVEVEIGPLEVSDEKIALCKSFFDSRYPGRGNNPEEYYSGFFLNTVTNTYEFRYRVKGKLLGVAIVDVCEDSLNAVYFYFDPREAGRSPGTFNVLYLIDFCLNHNITYIYLGYWVKEIKAMRYKANFRPHYLFINGRWQQPEKNN